MAASLTILALALPWLVGTWWVRAGWRAGPAGVGALALGYGYIFGWLLVTFLLRWQAIIGNPPNVAGPLVTLGGLTLIGAWWIWRGTGGMHGIGLKVKPCWEKRWDRRWPFWPSALFAVLLVGLSWRLAGLAQEIWWRPLFPWDAWSTWAIRARVWSELREWVPFVDPQRWLTDTTGLVYTIDAWNYPVTVPLVMLWPTLAFGAWNETIANLPWFGAALALSLAFYGQARLWGATPLVALLFTSMLLSLPILDTHVALAGYADLWMTLVFSLATMAFFQWLRDGDRRQALLALLLASACPLIKLEGTVWLLLFFPALIVTWLRGWLLWALMGMIVVLGLVWFAFGGIVFQAPGLGQFRLTPELIQVPYLGSFHLSYHAVWTPVLKSFFVLGNWHLFWYLLVVTSVLAIRGWKEAHWRRVMAVFVISCLLVLFVLFFMTDARHWAEQYTSINRVCLHFVPTLLFWMLTVLVPPRNGQEVSANGLSGLGEHCSVKISHSKCDPVNAKSCL